MMMKKETPQGLIRNSLGIPYDVFGSSLFGASLLCSTFYCSATENQAVSMNRILAISLLSFALIGCASGPRKVALMSLVGKPLDDVAATYGRPMYGGKDSLKRDSWEFDIDGTTTYSPVRPVTLAGTVGDQPVTLTGVTTGSPVTSSATCRLRVVVDESKTVVSSTHYNDAVCSRYFR